jgi:hypothetical protein
MFLTAHDECHDHGQNPAVQPPLPITVKPRDAIGTHKLGCLLDDGRFPYDGFPEMLCSDCCYELIMNVGARRWDLRRLALTAPHARSRERFLALHDNAQEGCTTHVAACIGRHPQTVMGWLHGYNDQGPEALLSRRVIGDSESQFGANFAVTRPDSLAHHGRRYQNCEATEV